MISIEEQLICENYNKRYKCSCAPWLLSPPHCILRGHQPEVFTDCFSVISLLFLQQITPWLHSRENGMCRKQTLQSCQLHAWQTVHCEHISSLLLLDCICSSIKTTAFKERQLFHLLSFIFGCVALFWDLHTCAYMEHRRVRASARLSAEQSRDRWHDGMKGGAGLEVDCKRGMQANEPLVVAVMLV